MKSFEAQSHTILKEALLMQNDLHIYMIFIYQVCCYLFRPWYICGKHTPYMGGQECGFLLPQAEGYLAINALVFYH